jgi:hypothetical protein
MEKFRKFIQSCSGQETGFPGGSLQWDPDTARYKKEGKTRSLLCSVRQKASSYQCKCTGYIGGNPKEDVQPYIQYSVANALPRKNSEMEYFHEPAIRESKIIKPMSNIQVIADPLLEKAGGPG